MEYGSIPYVGWHGEKMAAHITRTKSYVQNSALIIVIRFYEPYHDISSVFISNKTVSAARKLRWSTRQFDILWGRGLIVHLLSSARLAQ